MKLISLLGYVAMIAGLVGLALMGKLFSREPAVIVAQVLGVGIFLWARITFGRRSYHVGANPTEGGLVTTGPYRFIRHPIYAGMCLFVVAGVLGNWSGRAAIFGGMVVVSAVARVFLEEALVTRRYPEYREYAARTWRMAPLIF